MCAYGRGLRAGTPSPWAIPATSDDRSDTPGHPPLLRLRTHWYGRVTVCPMDRQIVRLTQSAAPRIRICIVPAGLPHDQAVETRWGERTWCSAYLAELSVDFAWYRAVHPGLRCPKRYGMGKPEHRVGLAGCGAILWATAPLLSLGALLSVPLVTGCPLLVQSAPHMRHTLRSMFPMRDCGINGSR
jgi:hypothetical protein